MYTDERERVLRVNITVHRESVAEDFLGVLSMIRPRWREDTVRFEASPLEAKRGLLNTMVKCFSTDNPIDAIMVRIHNPQVSKFVDRSIEVTCIQHLNKIDCAPLILAVFNNGFCYEFIEGETLNCAQLSQEPIWRKIAEELAMIHSVKVSAANGKDNRPQLEKLMELMWSGYPDELPDPEKNRRFKTEIPKKEVLQREIKLIQDHLKDLDSPIVLAHNDTRPENIIWNQEKGCIKFIDFESIDYNYQAAEIALHFSRFADVVEPNHSLYPSEAFQLEWLGVYLKKYYACTGKDLRDPTESDTRRLYVLVNKFYLLLLISSGVSGPALESKTIFSINSIDFLGNTISNIKEYYARKEDILRLQMPPQ